MYHVVPAGLSFLTATVTGISHPFPFHFHYLLYILKSSLMTIWKAECVSVSVFIDCIHSIDSYCVSDTCQVLSYAKITKSGMIKKLLIRMTSVK